jgi:hypothetical protein
MVGTRHFGSYLAAKKRRGWSQCMNAAISTPKKVLRCCGSLTNRRF